VPRQLGQHATRPDVADLIASFCLRDGAERVLDPSCGSGALLQAASRRAAFLGGREPQLTGVELDARLAREASQVLPGARIVQGDFLEPGLEQRLGSQRFDAVLGNPPYVRQEQLPAGTRTGRADLHLRFWPAALALLRDGGRMGFLTSSMWLDAGYGSGLRGLLARGVTVVALIESACESWFHRARVRTVICILEKQPPAPRPMTRTVRLEQRLDEIAPLHAGQRARLGRLDELARSIEQRPATVCLLAPRWGSLLRASPLCEEIVAAAGDRLVPLAEVAGVRWGIKSGDDELFFPHRDSLPAVEARYLVPAVFSLMDLDRVVVTEDQLRRRLLRVDLREEPAISAAMQRLLRRAQRDRATHRRPTCAQRESAGATPRRWFELRPGPPGQILWSVMQQYRHLVPFNPHGFPSNDNLLLIYPAPGVEPKLLAALLNSHVQALLKGSSGRWRNEGMIKMQAEDLRRMPVPDPRRLSGPLLRGVLAAFDVIASRRVGKLTVESGMKDRARLDRLVLQALGFPPRHARAFQKRLCAELTRHTERERQWEQDAQAARRTAG